MKKIYALMLATLAGSAMTISAQTQVTNGDFGGTWKTCYPWAGDPAQTKIDVGTTPDGWCVANVLGMGGAGKTVVAKEAAGVTGDGSTAVQLINTKMLGNVIPGYIAIGTTWNTAKLNGISPDPDTKDGGSFGGAAFAAKPDALSFAYKNAANSTNKGTALAYIWKGTYTQTDVPVTVALSPATATMIDRDRNILDMPTQTGSKEVSKTDGAALIAVVNKRLDNSAVWKTVVLPFDYKSDAAPEKINIAFAAGDYFSFAPTEKDEITVTAVKLVYYNSLKSVTVGGTPLADFAADKTAYTLPAGTDLETVVCTPLSSRATVARTLNSNVLTVKVTNQNGEDADGTTERTYTFTVAGSADKQVKTETLFPGKLDVECELLGGTIAKDEDATVHVVEYTDGTYELQLPNFTLSDLGTVGDINVPVTLTPQADGSIDYAGEVKQMQLADGTIVADVDAKGTETPDGKLVMNIDVNWDATSMNAGIVPIKVTFNGKKESAAISAIATDAAAAEAVYFNLQGVRVNGDLAPGIYIRRQGNASAKVLVK